MSERCELCTCMLTALVRALEALQDGDLAYAEEILAAILEEAHRQPAQERQVAR